MAIRLNDTIDKVSAAVSEASPPWQAHITLVSGLVPGQEDAVADVISEKCSQFAQLSIQISGIARDDFYFKRIFLRIQRTGALVGFASLFRKLVQGDIEEWSRNYDPHISMIYSHALISQDARKVEDIISSVLFNHDNGWTGGRICFVDTRPRMVADWKILREWSI